jgi:hypothetical protein
LNELERNRKTEETRRGNKRQWLTRINRVTEERNKKKSVGLVQTLSGLTLWDGV